ncbi:hypothetical protein T492DRAFT_1123918 [Pavlovales sp. CCMP2436]|nr:hypothetical protein T492DRAFT_1123918 [Pavlovales sp. CCMP2436]
MSRGLRLVAVARADIFAVVADLSHDEMQLADETPRAAKPERGKSQKTQTRMYATFDSWAAEHGLSNYSLVAGGQAQQSLAAAQQSLAAPPEQLAPTEMLSPTQDPYACLTPPRARSADAALSPTGTCSQSPGYGWLFGELQNGPAALLWAADVRAFAASPSPPGRLIRLSNLHNPVAFKAWCVSEND